jgi:predicted phage baseplate assembly protein
VNVRNPLAAQGGTAPESIEQVRVAAPYAFHGQERCVTADDYAAAATRHPEVGRAAAELRWIGSWYTAFVAVTRRDGRPIDDRFKAELLAFMQRFRPAGYDVEILAPRSVPLEIVLPVIVRPDVFRSVARQSLREIFAASNSAGFFYPGRFGFGQPVYLSQVVSAAMRAPGVVRVNLNEVSMRFQRWGRPPQGELHEGRIALGSLEIARLDNESAVPRNGSIEFVLEGGR